MIEPDKRKAIYCFCNEGLSIREISRRLKISRNTVRVIIKQKGNISHTPRADRVDIDAQLLRSLYDKCNGWVERIHEILTQEKGMDIGYSTLTRLLRELELGTRKKQRCLQFADQPGEEMQQDTSPYVVKIGDKPTAVIGSLLYFRYSKMRYLKFYRSFDRFRMKCFFHEALTFFGYTARVCIIDNTNEHEQSYLIKLPPYVQPPYIVHGRATDQYGYISFAGNFYWVPGTSRDDVKVIQYSDYIEIYQRRKLLVEYCLPLPEVKNQRFNPPGQPQPPHQPKDRKKPTVVEEQKLRSAAKEIDVYLTFALKQIGDGKQKHRFIRQLYGLYQQITLPLLIKTLERSLKYRIVDIETLERIAVLEMQKGNYQIPFPSVPIDKDYQERESYREGQWSDEVDLSGYDL
jgi:transposase